MMTTMTMVMMVMMVMIMMIESLSTCQLKGFGLGLGFQCLGSRVET